MNGKLMHIVGGGFNQVPLVKKAKEKGLRVLVTDSNDNPPAKEFSDLYEKIDTTNREATLRCAQKNAVDYILTDMTDVAVPTVAYVAEKMGLCGIGYETALRFTNKHIMRTSLPEELKCHIPKSHYFENANDALAFYLEHKSLDKFVVKPVNSQGSKGVSLLPVSPEDAKSLIFGASAESRDRGVLLESYIEGFEYSVETFVCDSKVYDLTLTKKYHYVHNPCLDERNTFLGDVASDLEKMLFSVNRKIVKALGLKFGLTHAEYKIENGQVYLIEIAARGAGGSISSHIIPYLTEFDTLGSLIDIHLGKKVVPDIKDYKKKFAVLKFFNFKPGKVKKLLINRRLLDEALIYSFDLKEGEMIRAPKDSRDRTGYFVVHGENREEVLKREKSLESAVQVEYE